MIKKWVRREEAKKSSETTAKVEAPKGRVETDYFFPDQRKTIRASSLEEAIKKLKNNE